MLLISHISINYSMNYDKIINAIVTEPVYLSIVIIFSLLIVYSLLKKFFKLLIIVLSALILYISFLIYTGQELPGNTNEFIDPILENAGSIIEDISKDLKTNLENTD